MPRKRPGVVLTAKQRIFCHQYVIDRHGTKAAVRAGYSEDSARSTASHLLDDQDVQDYIAKLEEDQFLALNITALDVKAELIRIGFSSVEDMEEVGSGSRVRRDETNAECGMGNSEVRSGKSECGIGNEESENECKNECKENSVESAQGEEPTIPETVKDKGVIIEKLRNNRAVLSYRRVVVDPKTGSRTTITFSMHHKIMALRILAQHFGMFSRENGKQREEYELIKPEWMRK